MPLGPLDLEDGLEVDDFLELVEVWIELWSEADSVLGDGVAVVTAVRSLPEGLDGTLCEVHFVGESRAFL